MITDQQIVIRLCGAAVLGGLVGLEREKHQQPAGLRTHIILSIGAALAMCLSIDLAMQFQPLVPNGDPARLAGAITRTITVKVKDRPMLVEELKQVFTDLGIEIKSISFSKDVETNDLEFEAIAKVPTQQDADKLIGKLSHVQGIHTFELQ